MSSLSFLVVDDCPSDLKQILSVIDSTDKVGARSYSEAMNLLKTRSFDVLLTDIHLTENSNSKKTPEGLILLRDVKQLYPWINALAISRDPDYLAFEQAFAYGAVASLRKPLVSFDEIKCNLKIARSIRAARELGKSLPIQLQKKYPEGLILEAEYVREAVNVAKGFDLGMVIEGETGIGKEEFVKLIHRLRCVFRGPVPLVTVNCALLDNEVAISELFGSVKGSFTGAVEKAGFIEQANGGMLFLDEVHHLNMNVQKKLLRVMNDGSYYRVGDTRPRRSKFQVITASTKDLSAMAKKGEFLVDLYYRSMGLSLKLPALRHRSKEYLKDLIEYFLYKKQIQLSNEGLASIVERCQTHSWPGNIRELAATIERSYLVSRMRGIPFNGESLLIDGLDTCEAVDEDQTLGLLEELDLGFKCGSPKPLDYFLEKFEKQLMLRYLRRYPRRKDQYRYTGIPRSSFPIRLKRLGLFDFGT